MRLGLTTGALVAALLAVPASAEAEDTRPCVSRHEFYLVFNMTEERTFSFTRGQLERRWEVAGSGNDAPSVDTRRGYARAYPACAYGPTNYVVAWYAWTGDHRLTGVALFESSNEPHGHP